LNISVWKCITCNMWNYVHIKQCKSCDRLKLRKCAKSCTEKSKGIDENDDIIETYKKGAYYDTETGACVVDYDIPFIPKKDKVNGHPDKTFKSKGRKSPNRRMRGKDDQHLELVQGKRLRNRIRVSQFQQLDDEPKSIDDFCSWALCVEIPRLRTESRHMLRTTDLTDLTTYLHKIKRIIQIQRGTTQITCLSGLYNSIHYSNGPKGLHAMNHLYHSVKRSFYANDKDHLLHLNKNEQKSWEPSVINTNFLKLQDDTPILSFARNFCITLLSNHLDFLRLLLNPKKNNGRVKNSLDSGIHSTDYASMTKVGENGTMGPGLIQEAFKIPLKTQNFIGKFVIDLETIVLPAIGKGNIWEGCSKRNDLRLKYATEYFQLERDTAVKLKTEAMTHNLSFLTHDHVDMKNDHRQLHEDTVTVTAVILLSELSKEAQEVLFMAGYELSQCVQKQLVLYQQSCVGAHAERHRTIVEEKDPAYQCFMNMVTNAEKFSYDYYDFVENVSRLNDMISNMVKDNDHTFHDFKYERLACIDKMLYHSGILDRWFCFRIKYGFSVFQDLGFILFLCGETNGQCLVVSMLDDFLCNSFLGGKNNFQEAFLQDGQNIFILLSSQSVYMQPFAKYQGSTKTPRYQISNGLRYISEEDESAVMGAISEVFDIVLEMRQNEKQWKTFVVTAIEKLSKLTNFGPVSAHHFIQYSSLLSLTPMCYYTWGTVLSKSCGTHKYFEDITGRDLTLNESRNMFKQLTKLIKKTYSNRIHENYVDNGCCEWSRGNQGGDKGRKKDVIF